jgi:hypothetical protein
MFARANGWDVAASGELALSLSLDTDRIDAGGYGSIYTSFPVTGTAVGGAGGYTYLWTVDDNGGVTAVALTPNAASSSLRLLGAPGFTLVQTVFRLTVTDADFSQAYALLVLTYFNVEFWW